MYDGDIVLLDEFGGRCTAVGVCCNHNVDAIKRSGVCHACRAVIDYVSHLLVGADGVHSCNHTFGRIVEVEEELSHYRLSCIVGANFVGVAHRFWGI